MHEELKEATGIKCANCETCSHLGSDGDGPEYNGSWPVCNKVARFGYLRSFPFKKEMPCWEPDFWQSKFTDSNRIRTGSNREMDRLNRQFWAAVDAARASINPKPPTAGLPPRSQPSTRNLRDLEYEP